MVPRQADGRAPWHRPHDDDVGPCDPGTPALEQFYDRAADARAVCLSIATAGGREHQVACASSRHRELPPDRAFLVVLGSDEEVAYTGQFVVDLARPDTVRIAGEWTQASAFGAADATEFRPAPLARIVFAVYGRPLHLTSAMAHSLGLPSGHREGVPFAARAPIPPAVRLGCFACGSVLVDAVAGRHRHAADPGAREEIVASMSGLAL